MSHARALYDYDAQADDELSFKEGDVIEVTTRAEDWSDGTLNSRSGTFPSNYVEFFNQPKKQQTKRKPAPSSSSKIWVEATYDYDANDGDELSFKEGDRLEVIDKEGEDWWTAKNSSGSTGLIPSNYVKETSAPTSSSSSSKPKKNKMMGMFGGSSSKKTTTSSNNNKKKKKTTNTQSSYASTKTSSSSKPKKANFLASIQNVKTSKGLERSKKSHKKKSNQTKNRDRHRIAIESMMTADSVGCDDMVLLPKLTNGAIAQNLEVRHSRDLIYTYIGNVLISVNPFKWITGLFDDIQIQKYRGENRIDVPPHIFAVAEDAYRMMCEEEERQCCIISGESGAGKTEAAKQIMAYVSKVSGGRGDSRVTKVKEIILNSNPVLEAFGNAMTLRNNNSSRFGKYLEILFDAFGRPTGGRVTTYLLEKSRVVKPGPDERSFHIFYQLLNCNNRKLLEELSLDADPSQYGFLNKSGCYEVDNEGGHMDDHQEWSDMKLAMSHIGMNMKEQNRVFYVLAAVLHLGNVKFKPKRVNNADGSQVRDRRALQLAASYMEVDSDQLEKALCYRHMETSGETFEVPHNVVQANAARDALAKNLYSKLFDKIVGYVNRALEEAAAGEEDDTLSIGVLDIYGFEVFQKNGFEQFCINFVNEKLQQIFIELTLKAEQQEYKREGIKWSKIPYFDNKTVCDLIEGKRPAGVFVILDDTCKTMHAESSGVDMKFLQKLNTYQSKHKHYIGRSKVFTIKHYAGDVDYSAEGFCVANKDILLDDLAECLASSQSDIIASFAPSSKKKNSTAGGKIKRQTGKLVKTLMEANPHYVRCIKSNDEKRKDYIDKNRVKFQCKYLGLLENIKVRRAGFAYRSEFHRFHERFKLLSSATYPRAFRGSDRDACEAIVRECQKEIPELSDEAQLGKRKVFIKRPVTFFQLERMRTNQLNMYASRIQSAWHKFMGRKELVTLRSAIADTYRSKGKARSRGSVFRPFDGTYLMVNQGFVDENDAMQKILSWYADGDETERVFFSDRCEKLVAKGNNISVQNCILIITNKAFYIIEKSPQELKGNYAKNQVRVWHLRRRTELSDIEGVTVSNLADDYIMIRQSPDRIRNIPDKSHWMVDSLVKKCMGTGKKFGFFTRKHHCRLTGNIYCDEVCKNYVPLPDLGWYQPERIHNGALGYGATEMREDVVLRLQRKSEFAAVLFKAKGKGRFDARRFGNFVDVSSSFRPRVAPVDSLIRTVQGTIRFERGSRDEELRSNGGNDYVVRVDTDRGVSKEFSEKRQRREQRRQAARDRERKEEQARRSKITAERNRRLEAERKERIRLKKEEKAKKLGGKSGGKKKKKKTTTTSRSKPSSSSSSSSRSQFKLSDTVRSAARLSADFRNNKKTTTSKKPAWDQDSSDDEGEDESPPARKMPPSMKRGPPAKKTPPPMKKSSAPVKKKKVFKSSSSSSSSKRKSRKPWEVSDSDSEEEEKPAKKMPPAMKRGPPKKSVVVKKKTPPSTKKSTKKPWDDSDSEDDDEEDVPKKKSSPPPMKKKTSTSATKKKKSTTSKKKKPWEDSDDDSDEESPAPVQKKKVVAVKKKTVTKKTVTKKKKPWEDSDDDDDSDEEPPAPIKKKKVVEVKKKTVAKKKKPWEDSDDDDDDDSDEEPPAPVKKKTVVVTKKKTTTAKKKKPWDDSDDEGDDDSEEEKPVKKKVVPVKKKKVVVTKKKTTTKKKKKAWESSDDSDSDEEEKPVKKITKKEESDDGSDSEEEEEKKPVKKKQAASGWNSIRPTKKKKNGLLSVGVKKKKTTGMLKSTIKTKTTSSSTKKTSTKKSVEKKKETKKKSRRDSADSWEGGSDDEDSDESPKKSTTSSSSGWNRRINKSSGSSSTKAKVSKTKEKKYKVIAKKALVVKDAVSDGSTVGKVARGKIVTVVETQGRRVRLSKPIKGWASLKTASGTKLLVPA